MQAVQTTGRPHEDPHPVSPQAACQGNLIAMLFALTSTFVVSFALFAPTAIQAARALCH